MVVATVMGHTGASSGSSSYTSPGGIMAPVPQYPGGFQGPPPVYYAGQSGYQNQASYSHGTLPGPGYSPQPGIYPSPNPYSINQYPATSPYPPPSPSIISHAVPFTTNAPQYAPPQYYNNNSNNGMYAPGLPQGPYTPVSPMMRSASPVPGDSATSAEPILRKE